MAVQFGAGHLSLGDHPLHAVSLGSRLGLRQDGPRLLAVAGARTAVERDREIDLAPCLEQNEVQCLGASHRDSQLDDGGFRVPEQQLEPADVPLRRVAEDQGGEVHW